jgi:L-sorbose 1-phosphate reductase
MKDTSIHGQSLPETQMAIQLVGPGKLKLNPAKPVPHPGPHQIVVRVEAVGLCFSDLKLLKQFSSHARKGPVIRGLAPQVLDEIPSYVPGEKPTVPGHEVVCRIVATGDQVRHHRVGERCLVQTDYRELRTAASNAAFGYNFEGGLQEYILMDERVILDPSSGERFLIPVDEHLSASAVALVEPWACVEDSYFNSERRWIKPGGRLLVVVEAGRRIEGIRESHSQGPPAGLHAVCASTEQLGELKRLDPAVVNCPDVASLPDEHFDDVVYFGSCKSTIEALNGKLAVRGICNIVTGGQPIGAPVSIGVGRVHYGMTRWIGTTGVSASDSYTAIPVTGEIRPTDKIAVLGAAGPMGQMHVIRNICLGIPGISMVGTDIDDTRLEALLSKVAPLAERCGVPLRMVNTRKEPLQEDFSYFALMVPAGPLVAEAIQRSRTGCLINIFAGIPATTFQELDLDTYIARRCFMFGTSGSVIEDMRIVLNRVRDGQLDTNCSVDAVCGMAGAVEALEAVEQRTLAGKIIVYPMLHRVGLIPLSQIAQRFPAVAEKLELGQWTLAAEQELLRTAGAHSQSPDP